jgi:hypothetical protein
MRDEKRIGNAIYKQKSRGGAYCASCFGAATLAVCEATFLFSTKWLARKGLPQRDDMEKKRQWEGERRE